MAIGNPEKSRPSWSNKFQERKVKTVKKWRCKAEENDELTWEFLRMAKIPAIEFFSLPPNPGLP